MRAGWKRPRKLLLFPGKRKSFLHRSPDCTHRLISFCSVPAVASCENQLCSFFFFLFRCVCALRLFVFWFFFLRACNSFGPFKTDQIQILLFAGPFVDQTKITSVGFYYIKGYFINNLFSAVYLYFLCFMVTGLCEETGCVCLQHLHSQCCRACRGLSGLCQ